MVIIIFSEKGVFFFQFLLATRSTWGDEISVRGMPDYGVWVFVRT